MRTIRDVVAGMLLLFLVLVSGVACKSSGAEKAASGETPGETIDRVVYDTSLIQVVATGSFVFSAQTYGWVQYRNTAYPCGVSGDHAFVLVTPQTPTAFSDSLWVLMPGGGVGYYDDNNVYHGTESLNLERDAQSHLEVLAQHLEYNTIARRRLLDGWRVMVPLACDHDLYSGQGSPYYNNPQRPDDTVDGLLATMAAVDFVAAAAPGGHVMVQGTSAGAVGAWSLAQMFARNGIYLTGAILDAYSFSTTLDLVQDTMCSALHREDVTFSIDAARRKVGPLMQNSQYYVQNQLQGPYRVPLFVAIGELDYYCCGDVPAVAPALAAGFENNCRYAYSSIESAIVQLSSPLYRFYFAANRGHVLSTRPEAIQTELENWFNAVMASSVAPIWR